MDDDAPRVEAHLPLKPVDLHILLALTDGELHGYAMVKEIEAHSDGRVRLEPGNLYRYVRRLVEEGMVSPAERRDTGGRGDERRRYYRITALGRRVMAAEARRMRSLASLVEAGLVRPE